MRLLLAAATAALVLAPAAPAFAEGPTTDHRPEVAAGLTVGVPLAVAAVGLYAGSTGLAPLANLCLAVGPAGFGAGHLYRQDPARAGLTALGGYGAILGGGLLGGAIAFAATGGNGFSGATGASVGLLVGGLGYGAWAATDAYRMTSDR